ncbi:MAG: hemerythrin domain-containing protein [Rhodospirillaceae bacterium]|nr:hemerythrin domain-containing protein [Rhodospirillales bacterium]
MNVLDVLKDDHATVERLFSNIMATSSRDKSRREQLFHSLKEAVIKHSHAEEKIFYAPLRDKQPAHDMIEHGLDEHHSVEKLLQKMDNIPADSDDWIDTLENIHMKIKDHVEEEEGEIFPKAQQLLGDSELDQMTDRFLQTKEKEGPIS